MNENLTIPAIPHLKDYLSILFKHKWLIALIFLATLTVSLVLNFKAVPIFSAATRVLIEPENPNVIKFEEVLGQSVGHSPEYLSTQYKILSSRALAGRVVDALHLDSREGYGISRKQVQTFSMRSLVGEAIAFLQIKLGNPNVGGRKKQPNMQSLTPRRRAMNALASRLQILPVSRTRLVDIVYESHDPVIAAQMANKIGEVYLKMTTREATEWLNVEWNKSRNLLLESERKLQDYKETHNIVSLEDRENIITQKLKNLNKVVMNARTEKISLGLLTGKLRSEKNIEILSSLPEVIDNDLIQSMRREMISMLNKQSVLLKRYKNGHPIVKRLKSQIGQTQTRMNKEIKRVVRSVMARYKVASERLASFDKALEIQKKEALRLGRLTVQYNVLKRTSDTNRKIFENIASRKKETNLMEGLDTSNIRIIDVAEIPAHPVRPKKTRNIFLAGAISLFFGFAVAFLIDYFDMRIKSPDEAEEIVGAPTIGVISDFGKMSNRAERIFLKNMEASTLEQFRQIRTLLAFRAGNSNKVFQVTSCIPAEGKSLISAVLGVILSETNKKVLLIDGDFYREGLRGWLNVKGSEGIQDILFDHKDSSEVIINYESGNMDVLVSGINSQGDQFASLLTPLELKPLIDSYRENYDYIIIDTPPLLAVSDPLIWSQCVDGILMVLDVNQINSQMLRQAISKIKELDVNILGLILNRMKKTEGYYYYGYGKKYGSYV